VNHEPGGTPIYSGGTEAENAVNVLDACKERVEWKCEQDVQEFLGRRM